MPTRLPLRECPQDHDHVHEAVHSSSRSSLWGFPPRPWVSPPPSTFQPGKLHLCTSVPRAGGVLQPFSMSALCKAGVNLSTKCAVRPALAKPCQPMAPAVSVCHDVSAVPIISSKHPPVYLQLSSQPPPAFPPTSSLDEASWKLTKPGLWTAIAIIFLQTVSPHAHMMWPTLNLNPKNRVVSPVC